MVVELLKLLKLVVSVLLKLFNYLELFRISRRVIHLSKEILHCSCFVVLEYHRMIGVLWKD